MRQKRLPLESKFRTHCTNEDCIVEEYTFEFFVLTHRTGALEGEEVTLTSSCPFCDSICEIEYANYDTRMDRLRNYVREFMERSHTGACEGCGARPGLPEEENGCELITLVENPNGWLYLMCPECLVENSEEMTGALRDFEA